MYYVYLIKSCGRKWFYVGFTKDLERRLRQHNSGKNKSTKPYKPFNLIFVHVVESRNNARDLEKYLKVRFNKEALLNIMRGW